MKVSTRNQLKGTVSSVTTGSVNSEISLQLEGNQELVSIITNTAVKNLDLKKGDIAYALIKSSSVIIGVGVDKVSARNQIQGVVISLLEGAVNDEVVVEIPGGNHITSIITKTSSKALGLDLGKEVCVIIKASEVIIAID